MCIRDRNYIPNEGGEAVKKMLEERIKDLNLPYVCVHSESPNTLKDLLASDMFKAVDGKRVLMCSPTITAGNSLEEPVFTNVVAYGHNVGEYGATVDAFLQQLFRARNLGPDGCVDIYINDFPVERLVPGPLEDAELDANLKV